MHQADELMTELAQAAVYVESTWVCARTHGSMKGQVLDPNPAG